MDDIRRKEFNNRLKRRANFTNFVLFFKKNWYKILIIGILIAIIFFPESTGSIVGDWFNKIVTSFVKKLTF
jgi:hypothetical protein